MLKLMPALALVAASPVMAAPVYLQCELPGGSSPGSAMIYWDIALNEEAGTVSYTSTNGDVRVENHPAMFTAREVSWNLFRDMRGVSGGVLKINRADLSFTRTGIQVGNNPRFPDVVGQCRLADARERAF